MLMFFVLVDRDGFEPSYSIENRFLTTIVFTTIYKCLQSGLSLHHFQMPGIKSLHSKFLSSSGLSSALLPVKTSPTQPSFHHTISCMSCNFCFYKQSIQSAAFSHSATCPNAERLLIIHFDFCFVNTFFQFFNFIFHHLKVLLFLHKKFVNLFSFILSNSPLMNQEFLF